jgi:transcriptional regulator with XRE-family HTH domain
MKQRSAGKPDIELGKRIRLRRVEQRISQAELGDQLGVSFQQVQKYEKGVNRVGASRLQQIAHILRVPVEFFFEGGPGVQGSKSDVANAPSLAHVSEFLASADGLTLVAGFVKIRSAKLRRSIVELVSYLAQNQDK